MKKKFKDKASLRNQLENTVTMAAKEDQIIWAIFGVFWAANAVLLVALFTEGQMPDYIVGTIVSFVGIILSVIWFLIQSRAINWLKYYESLIHKIEKKLKIPLDYSISALRNKSLYNSTLGNGVHVRSLMVGSGIVTSIAWFVSFLIFFIELIC